MIVSNYTTGTVGLALLSLLALVALAGWLLRERLCFYDGRRIVGVSHSFRGHRFCSRQCAGAWAVNRIEGLRDPDLPTRARNGGAA